MSFEFKSKSCCLAVLLLFAVNRPSLGQDTVSLSELKARLDVENVQSRKNVSLPPKRLEVDWIGNIVDDDGETTKLRLEEGGILQGELYLWRMQGRSFLSSEGPRFRKKLPTVEQVRECKKLWQLVKFFGKPQGFSSGWISDGTMHSSAGWVFVTQESETQLRYLSVFVLTESEEGATPESVLIDSPKISQGLLRPAKMDSAAEFAEYPTGESLRQIELERKKAERQKYARPLRTLLAAYDRRDSDQTRYVELLNEARRKDSSDLIRQLIEVLHERPGNMRSHFEFLMGDQFGRLEAWGASRKKQAMRECIEALPNAKNEDAIDCVLETLLRMHGGGEVAGYRFAFVEDGYSYGRTGKRPPIKTMMRELKKLILDER